MQANELIDKYYSGHEVAKNILIAHSQPVARFAVSVAENIGKTQSVDTGFVKEAALLHDIGMLFTDAPDLGCHGAQPYITHGIIGAELLCKEGLPRHALVCERHIGVGLTIDDIKAQGLPLPLRDMRPQSLEEQIIAYADLFFSKSQKGMRSAASVRTVLAQYGRYKVDIFDQWHRCFTTSR